jgi:hypothetical protein
MAQGPVHGRAHAAIGHGRLTAPDVRAAFSPNPPIGLGGSPWRVVLPPMLDELNAAMSTAAVMPVEAG